ncbi:hypothetical protein F5Y12DRAFT_714093 [Xylaria sp. FL1777]|nr:hypothetical protein F5Y12DRAFT_714093 [Xylaria sp. FL1777]
MPQAEGWVVNPGNSSSLTFSHFILNIIFISIALYNFIELTRFISSTSWCNKPFLFAFYLAPIWTAVYSVSWIMDRENLFQIRELPISPILVGCNYMANVLSFVLYSELQVLYDSHAELPHTRATLIATKLTSHLPFIVTSAAFNNSRLSFSRFSFIFSIFTEIRGILLTIQEIFLSELYMHSSRRFNDIDIFWVSTKYWGIIYLLILNLVALVLNNSLDDFDWAGSYSFKTAYGCLVYSIKWRVESHIFNILVDLNQAAVEYKDQSNRARWSRKKRTALAKGKRRIESKRERKEKKWNEWR